MVLPQLNFLLALSLISPSPSTHVYFLKLRLCHCEVLQENIIR